MYVHVPKWPESSGSKQTPFVKVPDHCNKAVQALIDQEISARTKYNAGFWAKVFGRRATERANVLIELKRANVMEDDRYFMASMSQERI